MGIWLLTKYRAGTSLSFFAKGVNFDGFNLYLTLGVNNSSLFPISFQSFSGDLYANGSPLGHVSDQSPVTIRAMSETDIQLSLIPNFSSILQTIKNIFSSGQPQTLELKGTLVAENLTLPVDTIFQTLV